MRGKDTKERIVEEAFALFASRGFHAVSVRDIAAAVGIKDASLYNHFPASRPYSTPSCAMRWSGRVGSSASATSCSTSPTTRRRTRR